MLTIQPDDDVPIWKQIENGILHQIATGALRPGEAAPSVRELARLVQVNPLTIQKAYRRLIEQGVLVVQRGEGTYVSASPPQPSAGERERGLAAAAGHYVIQARTLRCELAGAVDAVNQAWQSQDSSPSSGQTSKSMGDPQP